MLAGGKPSWQAVSGSFGASTPFVAEQQYLLWPGAVSDSQYAVTEDTLVFMKTRDGAQLASYIARPVGKGPFGVVLQRTPYTRILHPAGRYWASHGYIFVAQHVRGRDVSDGNDFGDYDTDVTRRLRRGRVGGEAARREREGRADRTLGRGTTRVVRRRERAAASRGDRAVGGERRSVAHRAVRRHGVLADQRRLGVPHARAHAAEHGGARHRRRRSRICR